MPPRTDSSSSLMVQSAKANKEKIQSLVELYNHKRNEEGDDTNFEKAGEDKAKKFGFLRWMSKKASGKNVDRFTPKVDERLDSISGLASGAVMPSGAYFDPLGLKIIKPDIVQVIGSEYEQEVDASEAMASQIESDFVDRVDEEITDISKNDYEERFMDENSELALIQAATDIAEENETEMTLEDVAELYNAGKAFVPNPGYVEAVPDSFQIELKVFETPPDYSLEWEQYKADRLKSISTRIGNYFKSLLGIKVNKTQDMQAMEEDFIKSLPEYTRIRREGEQEAKKMKVKYDPETDNRLQNFVIQTYRATRATSSGHSLVKLIAKRDGRDLSVYSFAYGTIANTESKGVVRGAVSNPAVENDQDVVMTRQDISYSDYLKAAARIRGVVGSMKTYSILSYNCTSFAASVAQAAGLDVKPEDTTRKITTLRHGSELIETPYDFSRYISYLNSNKQEETMDTAKDEAMIDEITKPYLTRFENEYENNRYLQILASYGMVDLKNAKERAKKKIRDIVTTGYYIDKKYPLSELMGEDFGEAIEERAREKNFALGARSEEQAIERLFAPENEGKAFKLFIDFPFTYEIVAQLLDDPDFDISDMSLARMFLNVLKSNEYFKNRYSDLPNAEKLENRIAVMTLGRIKGMQSQIIGQILSACEGKEDGELVDAFVNEMGEYTFGMLSRRVLNSGETLERFVELSGVELPYITKDGKLADSEAEADLINNSDPQERHVFDAKDAAAMISMSEIIDSEIVMHFTRRFREEIGIYGFSKKTKAPFFAASELEDFFVEAARMPELKDDVDKLFDQITKHEGYDIRDYTEFFEQVIFKLNPDKLADLMERSQIE